MTSVVRTVTEFPTPKVTGYCSLFIYLSETARKLCYFETNVTILRTDSVNPSIFGIHLNIKHINSRKIYVHKLIQIVYLHEHKRYSIKITASMHT